MVPWRLPWNEFFASDTRFNSGKINVGFKAKVVAIAMNVGFKASTVIIAMLILRPVRSR